MKNILCLIDFSEASKNALKYGLQVAEGYESNLIFMYVIDEKIGDSLPEGAKAEERLALMADEVKGELNKHHTASKTIILEGKLLNKIVDFVEKEQIDLIVKGTRTADKGKKSVFGSLTLDLIEKSPCPVLSIPESARFTGLKTIVYATRLKKEDKRIIHEVISLAALFNANLHVIHFGKEGDKKDKENYDTFKQNLLSFVGYKKLQITRKTYQDEVAEGINQYMNQLHADLLVLIFEHRGFLSGMFHTSLTEKMTEVGRNPLLVFPID